MKLKLITLLLACGLLACGMNESVYSASKPGAGPDEKNAKAAVIDMKDALKAFCTLILDEKHPQACTDACKNLANPSWSDLTCCVAAAKSFGKISSTVETAISLASKPGCMGGIGGIGATCGGSPVKDFVGKLCGALNCNTKYDDVTNCLAAMNPKMTCEKDFALPKSCVLCTGNCCPDKDGNYCIASACTKNKEGKYQCPDKKMLKGAHTGGW